MLIFDNAAANAVLRSVLARGISNDLIKPVLDDPNMPGDVLLTAYIFHIVHVSKVEVEPDLVPILITIADKLRASLLASTDSLSRELFISSALCLFDHAQNIRHHEWLLTRLYRDGYDFRGALADSPFVESFYEDKQRSGPARSRYVRVPKAYAILVSIYIALSNERHYFKFRGVKKLIGSVGIPYSHFVSGDRQRSAIYFVFFLFLTLFPEKYFSPPRPKFGKFFSHRGKYYFGNMNWASWLGFVIAVGCLLFSLFFAFRGLTASPMDWSDIRYAGVLFVFGFVGWLIRSVGGKKE